MASWLSWLPLLLNHIPRATDVNPYTRELTGVNPHTRELTGVSAAGVNPHTRELKGISTAGVRWENPEAVKRNLPRGFPPRLLDLLSWLCTDFSRAFPVMVGCLW